MSRRYNSNKRKGRRNKNRPWDTPHYAWAVPLKFAVLVVIAVLGLITYALIKNGNNSLQEEIAREEAVQADLMDELIRETNKWNSMKTPRNLEARLLSHGIAMSSPRRSQRVAMNSRKPGANDRQQPTSYAANNR